ncbi:MAG: glycosyltransferase family 2 protein [Puniceicoccaceae bacterium]
MNGGVPEISVVTALYGRLDLTRRFVDDLARTLAGIPHELILVDDGSSDGTREYLRSLDRPGVRAFLNERNTGFAASNNRGAREARAPVLAFLNNDLVLREGWCPPMRQAIDSRAGMVGNVQINAQTGRIDHAGIVFTPWGIPEHWGRDYLRIPRSGVRRFRAVTAACCLVRREVFLAAGGFDEGYRNGFEDIDLCLRLDAAGRENRVAFGGRVGHWISASPGRKRADEENIRRFLREWGDRASAWGRRDWPRHYLRRHLRRPWRLNGRKTLDALRMLVSGGRSVPFWMEERARALRETGRAGG